VNASLAHAPASVARKKSASAATAATKLPMGSASAKARSKAARGSGVGSSDSGACVSVPGCAAATTSPCCADHTIASSASSAATWRAPSRRQPAPARSALRRERTSRDKPGSGSCAPASSCVMDVMLQRATPARRGAERRHARARGLQAAPAATARKCAAAGAAASIGGALHVRNAPCP
jgi:hypothetical protein